MTDRGVKLFFVGALLALSAASCATTASPTAAIGALHHAVDTAARRAVTARAAAALEAATDAASARATAEGLPIARDLALSEARDRVAAARAGSVPPPPWRCASPERRRFNDEDLRDELKDESDRQAGVEWRRSRMVRARGGSGLGYYRRMRWLYLRRGVCDVRRFMEEAIENVTFYDRYLQVHVALVDRLAAVEQALREAGVQRSPFARMGGFRARTLRGPYGSLPWLSNHAFGKAIDVDPHRNPYLPVSDLEALELITGVDLPRTVDVPAGERWDAFKRAETLFKARVRPWLTENAQRIYALRARVQRGETEAADELERLEAQRAMVTRSRHLRAAVRTGFLSLPRQFVVEMEKVGFIWSTDFRNGADLMHFEYREPL